MSVKWVKFGKDAGLAEFCNPVMKKILLLIPLFKTSVEPPEFLSDFIEQLWFYLDKM